MSATGTLALLGGGEFRDGCRPLDELLLARAAAPEIAVLPTARAFEHPDRVVDEAVAWFERLGAKARGVRVLRRGDAEDAELVAAVRSAPVVYLTDGSPLHLRSVLKDSPLFAAICEVFAHGGVVAASGAGATVVCDPMVDPRGGAYTVGLGMVRNLAVFPYHGTAADHLRERSIDLLRPPALLAGIDEATALVRDPDGTWSAVGEGEVTLYTRQGETGRFHDAAVPPLGGT